MPGARGLTSALPDGAIVRIVRGALHSLRSLPAVGMGVLPGGTPVSGRHGRCSMGGVMTMTDLETLPNIAGWWLVSPGRKPEHLSPRERQILDMVTGGRSSKEVAYDLGVSDATVRVLYSRAMRKLGRSKRPREAVR